MFAVAKVLQDQTKTPYQIGRSVVIKVRKHSTQSTHPWRETHLLNLLLSLGYGRARARARAKESTYVITRGVDALSRSSLDALTL